ncbi:MAG: MarR family winged helix-turn-helix transcriptional regulator [Parvibaculum sp.]|nr:MarR family winged helix-turn-helix transcriptional regulator [Parvibaculum sp.]
MPDGSQDSGLLWFEVFNEIGIIEQLSRNAFERVMPGGLSLAGFTVLNHFIRLEKTQATPSELASAFQITKGAMTNTLKRLEALGYATLTANPDDGRGKIVRITAKGRKARDKSIAALTPQLAAVGAALPEREAAGALPFLRQLRLFLDEDRNVPHSSG